MVATVVKEGTRQNACFLALASTVRRQLLAHKQQLRSFTFRHDGLPEPARAGHHDKTKKRAGSEEREGGQGGFYFHACGRPSLLPVVLVHVTGGVRECTRQLFTSRAAHDRLSSCVCVRSESKSFTPLRASGFGGLLSKKSVTAQGVFWFKSRYLFKSSFSVVEVNNRWLMTSLAKLQQLLPCRVDRPGRKSTLRPQFSQSRLRRQILLHLCHLLLDLLGLCGGVGKGTKINACFLRRSAWQKRVATRLPSR